VRCASSGRAYRRSGAAREDGAPGHGWRPRPPATAVACRLAAGIDRRTSDAPARAPRGSRARRARGRPRTSCDRRRRRRDRRKAIAAFHRAAVFLDPLRRVRDRQRVDDSRDAHPRGRKAREAGIEALALIGATGQVGQPAFAPTMRREDGSRRPVNCIKENDSVLSSPLPTGEGRRRSRRVRGSRTQSLVFSPLTRASRGLSPKGETRIAAVDSSVTFQERSEWRTSLSGLQPVTFLEFAEPSGAS